MTQPTQPAQQEYIITSSTIVKLIEYAEAEDAAACIKSILDKEARPHIPQPEPCRECDFDDRDKHDSAVCNSTLDDLLKILWTDHIIHPDSAEGRYMKMVVQSLRTPTTKEHP